MCVREKWRVDDGRARNEQVCAHQKSCRKYIFQNRFKQLNTGWIVVVHLYCCFSLWRQMAPQQSAKFRTAFFWSISYQFEEG